MQGVYSIVCVKNGKKYFGSTMNIDRRWKQHKYELNKGTHHNNLLQRDWTQHGADAFRFELEEKLTNNTVLEVVEREQWYLDNKTDWASDYNISKSATIGSNPEYTPAEVELSGQPEKFNFWKSYKPTSKKEKKRKKRMFRKKTRKKKRKKINHLVREQKKIVEKNNKDEQDAYSRVVDELSSLGVGTCRACGIALRSFPYASYCRKLGYCFSCMPKELEQKVKQQ